MVYMKAGNASVATAFNTAFCQKQEKKGTFPTNCQIKNENSTKARRITEMASCRKSKVLTKHAYFH